MKLSTAALLASLALMAGQPQSARAAGTQQVAQATDTAPANPTGGADAGSAPPPAANAPPSVPSIYQSAPAGPAPTAPTTGQASTTPPVPTTGSLRNNAGSQPAGAAAGSSPPSGGTSVTFGGPQINTAPVSGSTLRDGGAGNGGVPVYSSAPQTLGGPINGTANAYTAPLGTASANAGTGARRNGTEVTPFTRQPLGGAPYTRDQVGNFGGRNGYTASGVYNGTAGQASGVGYGSPYAPSGRPIGGYASTNVDATGPLRPYIPLNTGTIGHPNSGYGVPNGSRPTTMDGRGVQRVN